MVPGFRFGWLRWVNGAKSMVVDDFNGREFVCYNNNT
jgi:hypothetical protein